MDVPICKLISPLQINSPSEMVVSRNQMQEFPLAGQGSIPSGQQIYGMPRNRSYTAEILAFTLGSVLLLVGIVMIILESIV